MLNKVAISGRISKEFELKRTNSGSAVVNFTLCIEKIHKTDKEKADYIECVAWNKFAENLDKYCKKGSFVEIVGKIQTKKYENSDGKYVKIWEIYCDEIHFVGNPRGTQERAEERNQQKTQQQLEQEMFDQAAISFDIMDEDIQF